MSVFAHSHTDTITLDEVNIHSTIKENTQIQKMSPSFGYGDVFFTNKYDNEKVDRLKDAMMRFIAEYRKDKLI